MATLVLTAVGGAVGGPIGAAVGAVIGQYADREVLFRPKGREGPRLTELRVQTSSYGTAIPKLFGTMRVAGTVIWSTDLMETHSSARAGKGQPSVTTYSYAASFAVLLSARAIHGVGRIWADGQLLRGAAGDFKVTTGFRLHPGGEDQPADPLIASAEGAALTPAHRGCAYAVFEQLPLATWGNRIPSLTFEVIADTQAPTAGAIAAAVADEVDGRATAPVGGFVATGGSVRAVLETLAGVSGGWWRTDGERVALLDAAEPAAVLADAGVAAAGARDAVLRGRSVAAADTVPRVVTVTHYDPARDWQAGLQRARRPGSGATELRVEVPAAIDAGAAKTLAEATLARLEAARARRTLGAGIDALALVPGDVVAIAGEDGTWRVTQQRFDGAATTLALVPQAPATLAVAASAGRVLGAPDLAIGATLLHVAELPALDDALLAQPRVLVAATGTGEGWRGAALLWSVDDGATWTAAGGTGAPATIGVVEAPPGAAPATLVDTRGAVVVRLARDDLVLADADAAALDRGANLALVGDELLQFGTATPLGGGRWRLGTLWRGRRGTEAAAPQVAGSRFVLLEAETLRALDLPMAALGGEVRVMATGAGDAAGPVEARASLTGASVAPPAVVGLAWTATADGGATVTWVRRSRSGWRWLDRVDVPLAEESERYRVTVTGSGGTREALVAEPAFAVTAAERAAGPVTVVVRQRGTLAESPAAAIVIG